jgi:hypothetical protein
MGTESRRSEMGCLRKMFGTNRMNVTGEWKKLYHEDFHNLYSSPGSIRVIKLTRMIGYGLDM